MEYRMKYRDVPWLVAFTLLPGKILGTFILKPFLRFKRGWKEILQKWLYAFMIITCLMVCITLVSIIINYSTGGDFFAWLNHIWYGISPQSKPEVIIP